MESENSVCVQMLNLLERLLYNQWKNSIKKKKTVFDVTDNEKNIFIV